ncbi:MAG: hypothetical protein H0V81_01685, partial [Solirubrobacterales bacterium]|nr:hypothetical protein [Solirubrobacterales bacterium]
MSTRLRRVSLLAGLGAVLPGVALAQQDHDGPHPPSGGDGPPRVAVSATAVDPKRVGVLAGERVEWVNASIRQHTITAREGQFDSPRLRPGQRFSHPFAAAGSFAYYCRIHPNITGIVDVANVLLHASASRLVRGDAVALAGRVRPGA